ncbi:pentatricopeptide repeat-containing protein At3g62890-like [Hibiscus syriacus]|uniref:pentatricopeptide repeat-containing protein At3g62890-like n=1 Tax=Hibiscus syriacus TaxID=106335 RepID=UPI001923AE2F|nr:pentatricopeptide repeat-containing protein At3g62890-like [Hibiscus syriacus]
MILHGLQPNAFLGAKMIAMYASSGGLQAAVTVFGKIKDPTTLLYNSIIRANTNNGYHLKTIDIYCVMHSLGLKGDHFTFPFVLKSCANALDVWMGACVHGQTLRFGLELDAYVGTSLLDFYVKIGGLRDANKVFDLMTVRAVSSWNALIAGYMKEGDIRVAEDLFRRMPCRNIVSWTSMISGNTQNGLAEEALNLFNEMLKEGSEVKPNWVTIMSVLPACAHSASLYRGRQINEYVSRIGLDSNPSVQTALVAMYAKCGSLADARSCFDRIRDDEKNLCAWNTMITAYASHGQGLESVSIFENMVRAGVYPDAITFTGLLSGCSHSGLVKFGLRFFNSMQTVYSIEPRHEHYACVVDLLARAGLLVEAKAFIEKIPMQPGPSIWGALLAACRKSKNLEIAEMAAEKLFVLEPENSCNYILLSNLYAEAGMWKEVDKLRARLKCQGVKKNPGCSWIEINGKAHLFLGGDISHPQSKEIYNLLEALPEKIKAAGYIPNTSFVLHDISEEEKEHNLITHSEKLAIAFGLLNTTPEVVLRVTKNLRICGDCHTVMKFISKIYDREIVVRDVNRFHHFRDGLSFLSSTLSLPRNIVSLCVEPEQFVATPDFCAGIQTIEGWIEKLGESTALDQGCRFDLSAFDTCLRAGIEVQSTLVSIDGNKTHTTDCFHYTVLYAAGIANELGPESHGALACAFSLPLNEQSNYSSKRHSVLVFGFTGAGEACNIPLRY